jgi:putative ABC transport system permease protein
MIRNYFKTAFRSLRKNRFFTLINIAGLTIGFTCCILMGLYIQNELSYDRFQQKGNRIARVIMEYSFGGKMNTGNYTSTKVAPAFKRAFPEVEEAVRMYQDSRIVKSDDKLFNEKNFMFADSTFFSLFSFPLVKGNPSTALSGPNKIILTKSTAKKYFGDTDPVGKTLLINSTQTPYEITGVIADCPVNSQIRYDFLASFSSLGVNQEESYFGANYTTYLLLKDEASIAALQQKIPGFMKKELAGATNTYINYKLEPFLRVHLYSPFDGFEPNNSITYIYIIAAVALLILSIACFTYINLGTAVSIDRAKEVGVRKVLGAGSSQIFWQHIGESLLLCFLSIITSIALVAVCLPGFNELADKHISFTALLSPANLLFILLIWLLISFAGGSYPALILAGFQPLRVLKGLFRNSGSGLLLRKSLIVFQFMISVFLIVSTIVIRDQLHYIRSKELGYDKEHTLLLPVDQKMSENFNTIRMELKKNKDILAVSRAVSDPTNIQGGYSMRNATMPETENISVRATPVDEEYVKATGLQIVAGSDLTEQDVLDVAPYENGVGGLPFHFILNESAAKELGWTPQQAIGQKMFLSTSRPGIVKAVVKDFHYESMHHAIGSLILFPGTRSRQMIVKLDGKNLQQTLSYIEQKWKTLVPHRPFEYRFMDEAFDKLYSSEMRLGKVLSVFASIAILLACLGLLGLSSFAAQQRIKEIGIRKVLGASVFQIVRILSKEFILLALIAFLLAFPLGWWAVHQWLQDFPYRTSIHWSLFPLTGLATILLALLTVAFRSVKAALSNPVKSLRTE